MKNMDLKYIKDEEVNLEKGDLLGTKPYANTLIKMIISSESPFTIGLLGGWGSGKSSIIKTVEEKFNAETDKSNIKVFIYDAWKYSNDSFRRTFILGLKKFFKLDAGEEYTSFYSDKNEEIGHEIGVKKGYLFRFIVFSPLLILFTWFLDFNKDTNILISILSLVLVPVMFLIKETFIVYKISINKPKTFAPEQFEDAFEDAIQIVTNTPNKFKKILAWFKIGENTRHAEKVVIVFDNIDRCHKELAFETIINIKNFLDVKNVIVVIPLDDTELKQYLIKEGHDGNEFLRKLFNTTLEIKKHSESDLFDYVCKLQIGNDLSFSNDVISLIAQEFSKNPRKIKQFVNNLQTELVLANEKENAVNAALQKGSITSNVEFLVKVLLIREEWPDLYEEINNNPFILKIINDFIDASNAKIAGIGITNNNEKEHYELSNEQKRFFESTRDIHSDNLLAFFRNRDKYSKYPEGLRELITKQDWVAIKEIIKGKKTIATDNNVISIDDLVQYIEDIFKEEVFSKKLLGRTGFNIISLVLKIALDDTYGNGIIELYFKKNSQLSQIRSHLNRNGGSEILRKLDFNLLFAFSVKNKSKNKILIGEIASIIDKQDIDKTNKFIAEFYSEKRFLSLVKQQYSSQLILDVDRIKIMNKEKYDEKIMYQSLIAEDQITNLIDLINIKNKSIELLKNNFDIVQSYNKHVGLSARHLDKFISELIAPISNDIIYQGNEYWYDKLLSISSSFAKISKLDIIVKMFVGDRQIIGSYLNDEGKESANNLLRKYLRIFLELYKCKTLSKSNRTKLISKLGKIFESIEKYNVWLEVNKIYLEIIEIDEKWPFAELISQKFIILKGKGEAKELSETMFAMLDKTTSDKGLSEADVKLLILSLIEYSQDKEYLNSWMQKLEKNDFIKSALIQLIKNLSYEKAGEIIIVFKGLSNDTVEIVLERIIDYSIDEGSLDSIFETMKKSEINLIDYSELFERKLKILNYDNDFGVLIDYILGLLRIEVLNDNLILLIIEKLKEGFISNKLTHMEATNSLRFIQEIEEKIPQGNKEDLLKSIKICKKSYDYGDDINPGFDAVISSLENDIE